MSSRRDCPSAAAPSPCRSSAGCPPRCALDGACLFFFRLFVRLFGVFVCGGPVRNGRTRAGTSPACSAYSRLGGSLGTHAWGSEAQCRLVYGRTFAYSGTPWVTLRVLSRRRGRSLPSARPLRSRRYFPPHAPPVAHRLVAQSWRRRRSARRRRALPYAHASSRKGGASTAMPHHRECQRVLHLVECHCLARIPWYHRSRL